MHTSLKIESLTTDNLATALRKFTGQYGSELSDQFADYLAAILKARRGDRMEPDQFHAFVGGCIDSLRSNFVPPVTRERVEKYAGIGKKLLGVTVPEGELSISAMAMALLETHNRFAQEVIALTVRER